MYSNRHNRKAEREAAYEAIPMESTPPAQSLSAAKRLPRYLKIGQVVAEYGLSPQTWRRLALAGNITAVELKSNERGICGKTHFAYDRSSIEAYLQENIVRPPIRIDDRQADREWRKRYAAENYRNGGKG